MHATVEVCSNIDLICVRTDKQQKAKAWFDYGHDKKARLATGVLQLLRTACGLVSAMKCSVTVAMVVIQATFATVSTIVLHSLCANYPMSKLSEDSEQGPLLNFGCRARPRCRAISRNANGGLRRFRSVGLKAPVRI